MKAILIFLALFGVLGGAETGSKAERVAQLRESFPQHLAPGTPEKMHPVARQCYTHFEKLAGELQEKHLSEQSVKLSSEVERALRRANYDADHGGNALGSAGRTAARFNARWLKEKVMPWVRRVAAEARR
jgi:hypothetical protein